MQISVALLSLAVAFAAAAAATPMARALAYRSGTLDLPKELGIHRNPTPRTGGVAIYAGWMTATVAAVLLGGLPLDASLQLLCLAAAGSLAFAVGVVEDARGLTPGARLAGELAAGLLLIAAGIRLEGLLPAWIGYPLTLLWFAGVMNALNLLDGMDGLAAGVAALAAAAFGALAALQGNLPALAAAAALLGSTLAFLRRNVHVAGIFMGDSGSLFLGLQLAALGVLLAGGQSEPGWLLAPLLVLGLPLLDTFGAILRRLRARRPLSLGDRRHAYDLLAAAGLGHTRTVRAMWLLSGAAGLAALALVSHTRGPLTLAAIAAAALLALAAGVRIGLFSPETLPSGPGTLPPDPLPCQGRGGRETPPSPVGKGAGGKGHPPSHQPATEDGILRTREGASHGLP